ncbi:MAG: hypothetical protein GY898_30440 [Proteobacteria bacterium]|nr:hypothetical protein [Pseudomonadota bacterium]
MDDDWLARGQVGLEPALAALWTEAVEDYDNPGLKLRVQSTTGELHAIVNNGAVSWAL